MLFFPQFEIENYYLSRSHKVQSSNVRKTNEFCQILLTYVDIDYINEKNKKKMRRERWFVSQCKIYFKFKTSSRKSNRFSGKAEIDTFSRYGHDRDQFVEISMITMIFRTKCQKWGAMFGVLQSYKRNRRFFSNHSYVGDVK